MDKAIKFFYSKEIERMKLDVYRSGTSTGANIAWDQRRADATEVYYNTYAMTMRSLERNGCRACRLMLRW
jgi:hypothetical protein